MTATANITDVDEFTDPIVAPADGDAADGATFQSAPQGAANRTRWIYNRLNGLGALDKLVFGNQAGVAAAAKFTFSLGTGTAYSVASSTDLSFPRNGVYQITGHVRLHSLVGESANTDYHFGVYLGASLEQSQENVQKEASGDVVVPVSATFEITDYTTQVVSLRNTNGTAVSLRNSSDLRVVCLAPKP